MKEEGGEGWLKKRDKGRKELGEKVSKEEEGNRKKGVEERKEKRGGM
jgi:hypothetical protein